ncbi:MAG: hypothetical protein E6Q97_34955 [Desulfurellales bacterium]|nr:MAG: hypothetical protein E6Q97_34955 [Desulfurellales bacterium]
MSSEFIIEGIKELQALASNYALARERVRAILLRAAGKFALSAETASKQKYLSGGSPDVLGVRSGRLRSSITPGVSEQGQTITISLGTGVPYGPIHEYGGPILRGGRVVGQMPERSFLGRAFDDTIAPFGDDVTTLIIGSASGGFANG